MKRPVLLLLALVLLCGFPVLAQQTPAGDAAAKEKDIRKLLELSGSAQIGQQVIGQMMDTFKQMSPDVPESVWTDMKKEFDPGTMVDLIVPIYDRHFTHEDVKGLIAFYQTPLGKKMIATLPAIAQESMTAGQQWGMEIAQKMQQKLEAQKRQQSPKGE